MGPCRDEGRGADSSWTPGSIDQGDRAIRWPGYRGSRQTYPILLEAVLRAEETALDPELDASGTLQRIGVVLAAYAEALPRG